MIFLKSLESFSYKGAIHKQDSVLVEKENELDEMLQILLSSNLVKKIDERQAVKLVKAGSDFWITLPYTDETAEIKKKFTDKE